MHLSNGHTQNLALLGIGLGAAALALVLIPEVIQINPSSVLYDSPEFVAPEPLNNAYNHVAVGKNPVGYVFIAGQRGSELDCTPSTSKSCLVALDSKTVTDKTGTHTLKGYSRIYKAYQYLKELVVARNSSLTNTVRLTAYTTDLSSYRATADYVESLPEFWGMKPPPRTIVQVAALDDNDVFEVEGTFQLDR